MSLTALHAATDEIGDSSQTIFEIIDQQNERLAQSFKVGKRKIASLLSTELVSNYLIQLANNPKRGMVYKELMDRSGNEIYLDEYAIYVDLYRKSKGIETGYPAYPDVEQIARKIGRVVIGIHGKEHILDKPSKEYTTLCPLEGDGDDAAHLTFDFHAPLMSEEYHDPEAYRSVKSMRTVSAIVVVGPGPL